MAAVVRQGEIVEQGSHGELIQIPNGAYATLVRLQASAQQPAMQQQKQQALDEISHQLQHSADPEVLKKVISSQVRSLLCYAVKTCSLGFDGMGSPCQGKAWRGMACHKGFELLG